MNTDAINVIIDPLIFAGIISVITMCPKGIVVPKINPNPKRNKNISKYVYAKLIHNIQTKPIKLLNINVLYLPIVSVLNAQNIVPLTIPIK